MNITHVAGLAVGIALSLPSPTDMVALGEDGRARVAHCGPGTILVEIVYPPGNSDTARLRCAHYDALTRPEYR